MPDIPEREQVRGAARQYKCTKQDEYPAKRKIRPFLDEVPESERNRKVGRRDGEI